MPKADIINMLLAFSASLMAGGVIGLDREFIGRAAGLRTHMMVALASTVLMLAATHQSLWILSLVPDGNIVADPTRMAHGVLTGIGFLGAGVIFREGASVHGLTTATSLWMAAALGLVAGAGLWWLTAVGTGAALLVLVLLRTLSSRVHQLSAELCVRSRGEAGLTVEMIVRALEDDMFRVIGCGVVRGDDGVTEHRLQVKSRRAIDVDALVARLGALPGALGIAVRPRD